MIESYAYPQTDLTVGSLIKWTRLQKALTLREVARDASINVGTLWRIEQDLLRPTEDVLEKVAPYLGLPLDDLMVLACRLGESGEEYFRRHPVLTRMLRRMAEADLPEAEIEKVARYVEGRIAQQEKKR